MEVPRIEIESELQLSAYATAIATQDLSHLCNLHHKLMAMLDPYPLSKARDQTHIFMDTSWLMSTAPHLEIPKIMFS